MLTDARLVEIATRLIQVPGIAGVMPGGSRARGTAHPDSDFDLGLYYRQPLDVASLRQLPAALASSRAGDSAATVTDTGAWGPWVDGGGWMVIDAAGLLHTAPANFANRCHQIVGALGTDSVHLVASVDAAAEILGEVRAI